MIGGRLASAFRSQSGAMNVQLAIGTKVRKMRKERGFSQEAFADHCHINRGHMGQIERGQKDVTISTLRKIGRGFGITVSQFLDGVT